MQIVPGKKLIHVPTNRPVIVAEVTETTFTVHTTDDTWIDSKTGKPSGGCAWELLYESINEFIEKEAGCLCPSETTKYR
ncbi:MAG: hypothetical protein ACPLRU_02395 [Desulfofundulus sp.]